MNETTSFPYQLTIGMIVKNEAIRLRTCLEGLAPLRQAIPCQLIISDTGSTDGTKDIAKEFADVYLEFEWCDDFAKARNSTTAMAKGRWYIYLDADHTFDDSLLALADFLNSPHSYTPIEAASLSIRNYSNPQGTHYLDSTSCLLHNFSKGTKDFVYPIHECIPVQGEAPLLPVLIHHWGYLVGEVKQNRNQPILEKAIQKDPLNFHHHHHLIRDTKDLTLRKEYLQTALAHGEQDETIKNDPFYWSVCLSDCLWAWESKDVSAFQEGKKRLIPAQENTLLHLELLGMELSFAMELEDTDSIAPLFKKYRQVFSHLEGRSNLPFRSSFRYLFILDAVHYRLEVKSIGYLLKKTKQKEALELLEGSTMLSKTLDDGSHPYLGDYTNLALSVGGFSLLRRWHETLVAEHCQQENNSYLLYLEKQFYTLPPQEQKVFLTTFSSHPSTPYTALWALRQGGYHYEKCPAIALSFLENTPDLYTNPLYRDVFYSVFRSGQDRFHVLERASLSHLLPLHKEILALDPQYYQLVLQGSTASHHNPKLQRVWGYLSLEALLHASQLPQNRVSLSPFIKNTLTLLTNYITAVYQPRVIEESCRAHTPSLLPPQEQFALFACQALLSPQEMAGWRDRCLAVYPCSKSLIALMFPIN